MEKQNLQEAAKNYAIDNSLIGYEKMPFNGFIAGANWQKNKSFTNDEVIDILQKRLLSIGLTSTIESTKIWFNQYKKL